jgi:hypothetical protein
VLDHLAAERSRDRPGVALDDDVDVAAGLPEQEVADGAADQIQGRVGGLAQPPQLRETPERVGRVVFGAGRVRHRASVP